MKKAIGLLLIVCIFLMAGCAKKEPAIVITKNMLAYDNDSKTFLAAKGRFEAIVEVIKTEVTLLENSHNEDVMLEFPDNYFLNEDYILNSFDPFNIADFDLTENFDEKTDESSAAVYYENKANGREVQYFFEDRTYTLKFFGEAVNDIYTVKCSKDYKSFSFMHMSVSSEGEKCEDFLDFIVLPGNAYAIQSAENRCYITFDNEGHIEYFRVSSLKDGFNTPDDTIFDSSVTPGKNWVTKNKGGSYNSIVEFDDGILTIQDSSTGTVKETIINEADYASVFLI